MLSGPVYRKPHHNASVSIGMHRKVFVSILFGTIAIAVGTFIWRFASRRHTVPCPVWLRWLVELDNPFTKTSQAAVIVDHLNIQPGMVVVDFGCGPGRVTVPVAKQVGDEGRVVAVDIQAGAGEGKLGHCRFDRALLVSVLGEIPDRKGALKEIFEALKSGGILAVTETIFDPHYQSRKTVTQLAAEVGFQEYSFFGNRMAYTLNLEKPNNG